MGLEPVWFWMRMVSPRGSGCRFLLCTSSLTLVACLSLAIPFSLASLTMQQPLAAGPLGRVSQILLSKTI